MRLHLLLMLMRLLHDVATLRKGTGGREVLTVPRMIFLHISAPVWIYDHHLVTAVLSGLLWLLLVVVIS